MAEAAAVVVVEARVRIAAACLTNFDMALERNMNFK